MEEVPDVIKTPCPYCAWGQAGAPCVLGSTPHLSPPPLAPGVSPPWAASLGSLDSGYCLGLAKERRRLNTGRRKERRHRLIPHFPPGRCSTTARLLPGSFSLSPSCLQAPLCPCALGPEVVTAPTAVSPGAPLVLVGFPNVIPPVAVNKSNPISVSQVSFTSSCWDL